MAVNRLSIALIPAMLALATSCGDASESTADSLAKAPPSAEPNVTPAALPLLNHDNRLHTVLAPKSGRGQSTFRLGPDHPARVTVQFACIGGKRASLDLAKVVMGQRCNADVLTNELPLPEGPVTVLVQASSTQAWKFFIQDT